MISVDITTALLLYLGCFLCLYLGTWIVSHFKQRRKKALPSQHALAICEYCTFAYLAIADKEVSQCPQCHSFNKKNFYKSENKEEKQSPL